MLLGFRAACLHTADAYGEGPAEDQYSKLSLGHRAEEYSGGIMCFLFSKDMGGVFVWFWTCVVQGEPMASVVNQELEALGSYATSYHKTHENRTSSIRHAGQAKKL